MKLRFLSKNTNTSSLSSWPWPSCNKPRTLSFRNSSNDNSIMLKTINNSAYLLDADETAQSSLFTKCTSSSPDQSSFSTAASDQEDSLSGDAIETVIRGLRSETDSRLFFEPGAGETNSILEEATATVTKKTSGDATDDNGLLILGGFKQSLLCSMESQDPYIDFKKSMEEMVEAHGIKDWEDLEELLYWYLTMNGKSNHGYIVGAFVDLLVAIAFASSSSSATSNSRFTTCNSSSSSLLLASNSFPSPSSPLSLFTSCESSSTSTPTCCLSSLLEAGAGDGDEIEKQQKRHEHEDDEDDASISS